jgi:ABC-2 type transport system permease protein
MRKVLAIAVREYLSAVRTKGFLISLLFMPIMMFGGLAAQNLFKKQVDLTEKRFAVVDRTPGERLLPVIKAAVLFRNANQITDPKTKKATGPPFAVVRIAPSSGDKEAIQRQRFELSERVRSGELFGFAEIGPDVDRPLVSLNSINLKDPAAAAAAILTPDERYVVRYQSNRPMYFDFSKLVEKVVSTTVQLQRGTDSGLSMSNAAGLIQPVPLVPKGLSRIDPATGKISDAPDDSPLTSIVVPMSLTILMLMMLMVGTSPLMQSVMEEKMQRIAEVLLGSVPPFHLMMGKLAGIVCVSLTTVAFYLIGAYSTARQFGFDEYLTVDILGWFVLFQVLGVIMYGSLFIGIGAACSDGKEAQSLLMPVMLVATAPVFALTQVLRDPNSPFAIWLSFFPFATPMLMTARIAIPPGIPWWQPALGVLGVLITTIGCVYAGGRVFRVGLLMQGKGARLSDLVKWVIHG